MWPCPRPLFEKFLRGYSPTVPENMHVKFEVRSFNCCKPVWLTDLLPTDTYIHRHTSNEHIISAIHSVHLTEKNTQYSHSFAVNTLRQVITQPRIHINTQCCEFAFCNIGLEVHPSFINHQHYLSPHQAHRSLLWFRRSVADRKHRTLEKLSVYNFPFFAEINICIVA